MSSTAPSTASSARAAFTEIVRGTQNEILLWVLVALYIPGFLLAGFSPTLPDPGQAMSIALILCLSLSVAFFLRTRSYLWAVWTVVGACLLTLFLMVLWLHAPMALFLLVLPVGLTASLISVSRGIAVAALSSLAALAVPAPDEVRLAALAGAWLTLGLIWLAALPLTANFRWLWAHVEQSYQLLDEAAEQRLQLRQALEDLADANLQLTRLNQLAQGLRLAAEEARRTKERFVANVSHELRTPLNMIIGFSEMIMQAPQAYGELPALLRADLAVILRNSQHLSRLVDDVLDLSQIEANRMALNREWVSLNELLDTATAAVRPLYEGKGLFMQTTLPAGLPAVFCDPTRIREVILNLLSNAVRFTSQGGVTLRVLREDARLVFCISDTGPGIAADDASRVFEPFEQVDASLRRRYGGTGLGLSISKSLVELHGGEMWLVSPAPDAGQVAGAGPGTAFYFTLPSEPPATDAGIRRWLNPDWAMLERTRGRAAPPPVARPRFVVADGGQALTRLLQRYLPSVEVVPVPDLAAAVRAAEEEPAQTVLLNEISVGAALLRLAAEGNLPVGTPVMVCSVPMGDAAPDRLGVNAYLVKPVSQDQLQATLARLAGPADGQKTVLIVEDEPDALQLFWRILGATGAGYRVIPATNGREALDLLHEERISAIVLDLTLPEMDGFAFLAARHAAPALRDIPVVIVSARDPAGQPIVANALAVTLQGGLSLPQLLGCIERLSQLLAPAAGPVHPGPSETPSG